MYEYHGWVTIRETPTCDDEKDLEIKIHNINEYIHNLKWCNGILHLHAVNGEYQVVVSGLTNHKAQEANDLLIYIAILQKKHQVHMDFYIFGTMKTKVDSIISFKCMYWFVVK